jgi:hypothetical protein
MGYCIAPSNYGLLFFFFFKEVRDAASNSAYYGYPKLWILRYPAHRYHAVPSPGFEPTTRSTMDFYPRIAERACQEELLEDLAGMMTSPNDVHVQ